MAIEKPDTGDLDGSTESLLRYVTSEIEQITARLLACVESAKLLIEECP